MTDCPDGEDEEDCPPEVEEKEDGEESSPEQSSSESSSSSPDSSSSSPRPVSAPRSCGRAEFQCRERHFCIHSAWLCDGDQDCPDGSDEVGAIELSTEFVKVSTIFQDGLKNLMFSPQSDAVCAGLRVDCGVGEFRCADGRQCLGRDQVSCDWWRLVT